MAGQGTSAGDVAAVLRDWWVVIAGLIGVAGAFIRNVFVLARYQSKTENRLGTLEDHQETTEKDVMDLVTSVKSLEVRLVRTDERSVSMEKRMERIEKGVTDIDKKLEDGMARLYAAIIGKS